MKKMALVFPGQGSQYVGMGKDFFDRSRPRGRFSRRPMKPWGTILRAYASRVRRRT